MTTVKPNISKSQSKAVQKKRLASDAGVGFGGQIENWMLANTSAVCCSTMTSEAPGYLAEIMSQCVLASLSLRLQSSVFRGSVSMWGIRQGGFLQSMKLYCRVLLLTLETLRRSLYFARLLRALRLYCRNVLSATVFVGFWPSYALESAACAQGALLLRLWLLLKCALNGNARRGVDNPPDLILARKRGSGQQVENAMGYERQEATPYKT